jgi:YVTN family beta-propeller protein
LPTPPTDVVTPINTATNTAGQPIKVGEYPFALAITPNGKVLEVVNQRSNSVTPINIATNRAGKPISVGTGPIGIAIAR